MDFYAQISNRKILPLHDSDEEAVRKLKSNKDYKFTIVAPRNYEFHKKFFALLNLGYQNTESNMNFEEFRAVKTMQAGYYKTIPTEKGVVYLPVSINFAKMDEIKFQELYSKMINVMIVTLGCTSKDIENELVNFM